MKKITVLGDIIMDKWEYTESHRLSPEAPVPVAKMTHTVWSPGGAANVAFQLKELFPDKPITLAGILGANTVEPSQLLIELCAAHNIDRRLHVEAGWGTPVKHRILVNGKQVVRLDYEQSLPDGAEMGAVSHAANVCRGGWLVISDYNKGVIGDYFDGFTWTHLSDLILANAKPASFDLLSRNAHIITLNMAEATQILGQSMHKHKRDIEFRDFCPVHGFEQCIIVTDGRYGGYVYPSHGSTKYYQYDAMPGGGEHVCGAGDAFLSGLVYGMAKQTASSLSLFGDVVLALPSAIRVAGLATTKPGTATVGVSEL